MGHDHDHGHTHDHAGRVDDALTASKAGIRAVIISLVILALTATIQIAIVAVSGSVALLADTIHNFSDALSAIPLSLLVTAQRQLLHAWGPTERYLRIWSNGNHNLHTNGEADLLRRLGPLGLTTVLDVGCHVGSWTDQAHIAGEHIPQLRQFIEA